jgi:DtxR family Mn-dependent transcriptional regulator
MTTRAVEDYLKAIYKLQQAGSRATTNAIAALLEVRAASVTSMFQQLFEQGLADYVPYRGACLTETGLQMALNVVRRHRLVELYLHRHLDVPWDRVHEEAELLEHAISPYLEELIDAHLGHPTFDPHGAPIPVSVGTRSAPDMIPLSGLPTHTPAQVRHVPDEEPDLLHYFDSLGLTLDATVTVTKREPFDGPISLLVAGLQGPERAQVLSVHLAQRIFVTRPA